MFHNPHIPAWGKRCNGRSPIISGHILQFVFPGSVLHATAAAREAGVVLAVVVPAVVEDLLQNCPKGVGPVEVCEDGGPDEEQEVGHGGAGCGGTW